MEEYWERLEAEFLASSWQKSKEVSLEEFWRNKLDLRGKNSSTNIRKNYRTILEEIIERIPRKSLKVQILKEIHGRLT